MRLLKTFLKSLLQRYPENLQEKMRGSEFNFDAVNLLHYDLNKISLNRGISYIKSPDWIGAKKATINPINKKNFKCFQ